MKHFDDILPEEAEADSQPLLEELRRTYRPELHDARVLARIREHLLAGDNQQKQIFFSITQQRERNATIDIPRERGKTLKPKTWRHTLGLVAAVLIVSLLVGSLVLTFTLVHRNTTGIGPHSSRIWPETPIEIHMFTASNGWALSGGNRVMRTTDGGVNWQDATPPDILNLGKRMVLVGPRAFYDTATAWVGVTLNAYQAPEYHSASTALLFHTTDGGKTWQKTVLKFSSDRVIGSFVFLNTRIGWFLTFPGPTTNESPDYYTPLDIWHTIDGGKTWTKILDGTSPGARNLRGTIFPSISFGSAQVGLLLGQNDRLYRTTDGGVTWNMLPWPAVKDNGPIHFSFEAPRFFTAKDALFSGVDVLPDHSDVAQHLSVIVYTTHDAGLTWHASPTPTLSMVAPQNRQAKIGLVNIGTMFIDMQHGWVSVSTAPDAAEWSQSNLVQYLTTDGGQHWTELPVSPALNKYSYGFDYSSASFISPDVGWLIDGKILFKTVDGGHNWVQIHDHFPLLLI